MFFMEELSYVLTQYFVSCFHVRFIFHCRSFSPCWPLAFLIYSPPLWIFIFFFLRNSSPLFSITRSSSFSVIHVSVNIKNNAEKDTTLLVFFHSKSPSGHVISLQIKPWVAFGLPYLLIELFYIGMPVVRTDGVSLARSVYGHVITKFSRMGRLPQFLSYGAPPTREAPRWSSAIKPTDFLAFSLPSSELKVLISKYERLQARGAYHLHKPSGWESCT